MKRKNNKTALFSASQGLYWMSFCVPISFASLYLLSLEYTNTQLGVILAMSNLFGALLGSVLSSVVDRNSRARAENIIPVLTAVELLALVALVFHPYKSVATTIAFVACGAFCIAVNPMNLKIYVDYTHHGFDIDYPFARGFGSVMYVPLSSALGALVKRTSATALPIVGIILTSAFLVAHFALCKDLPKERVKQTTDTNARGSSIATFLRVHPRYSALLIGVALLHFAHSVSGNFMFNVARNVGGDEATMGYMTAFTAATEIPVMLLFVRVYGNRDSAYALRVASVAFTLKAFATAFATNVPAAFAAFLLQAPSYALYTSAIVPYADQTIAYKDAAKAQGLAIAMTTLGSMLASVLGGRLYDLVSVRQTLLIAAFVGVAGTVVALAGVESRKA